MLHRSILSCLSIGPDRHLRCLHLSRGRQRRLDFHELGRLLMRQLVSGLDRLHLASGAL